MTIFSTLPTPLIFAHRGASVYVPENTIKSFQLAEKQGVEGIEFGLVLPHDKRGSTIHVTQKYVKRLHSAGFRVNPWTVNDEKEMQRLFSLKVDGMTTDDPLKGRRVREAG